MAVMQSNPIWITATNNSAASTASFTVNYDMQYTNPVPNVVLANPELYQQWQMLEQKAKKYGEQAPTPVDPMEAAIEKAVQLINGA